MTKAEKALYAPLKELDGAYLAKYVAPNGKKYYRLRTMDNRPLRNITYTCFNKMEDRGWIGKVDNVYLLDVPRLKQEYERIKAAAERRAEGKTKERQSNRKRKDSADLGQGTGISNDNEHRPSPGTDR